jgi:hypothetical protein
VPACANAESPAIVTAALQELIELRCAMSANPLRGLEFRWSVNTSSDRADIPRAQFSEHGAASLLTYTARTHMDYGTVVCAARNEVGDTSARPCVFHILPAGESQHCKAPS